MHFRTTDDGVNLDDTLLARTATAGIIGDYMRLVSVGPHFYSVFPAKFIFYLPIVYPKWTFSALLLGGHLRL
jgi:hypothetical protein